MPDEEETERWLRTFELGRALAASEGGRVVAGAGAFGFRITVPGGRTLPAAGVTIVGVLPTHRRRGILRRLMRAQLDDVRARGEPLAALWASEETIYGRFGYGLASHALELEIPKAYSAFRPGVDTVGDARLVDAEEAAVLLPPVYATVQRATPGMLERDAAWWEHRLLADPPELRGERGPRVVAVLEVDGAPRAYAIYRMNVVRGRLGPETTVQVHEAIGTTPAATASIWRYLLDVDWTRRVSAQLLPVDHPLLLLLARPSLARPTLSDGLWLRLVDVGAALSGRRYGDGPPLVLDVRDPFCPWNEGRWRLADGSAERTDAPADLALDVADLGAVYLGGFSFAELARAGRVEELREGAIGAADASFRTDRAPWAPETF